MLHITWLLNLILFWVSYAFFTKGRLTKHLGFYHFLLFFYSAYLASYSIYESNGSTNTRYLASVMLYPVVVFCGMVSASVFWRKTFFPRIETIVNRKDVRLVTAAVALFLLVEFVYLIGLWPNIPLLITLTSQDAMAGHVGRYFATKGYSSTLLGFKFLYWFPRIFIDYFAAFTAVFAYFHLRKKAGGHIKFALFVLFVIVITMLANEKYPAIKLVMVTALCYFNDRYGTFSLRTIGANLKMVAVSVIVGSGVYAVVSGAYQQLAQIRFTEMPGYVVKQLVLPLLIVRGMYGQSFPLYKLYEIIPAKFDYFMGRTLANPHHILPYEPVALPYLVYASYNEVVSENLRGADPTVFFGEIYANFGFVVSLLFMFLFGFLLQVMNAKLSDNIQKYRAPFDIAFFYLLMIFMGDFAIGFSVPYFDERVFFFIGLYFFRKLLTRRGYVGMTHTVGRTVHVRRLTATFRHNVVSRSCPS